MTSPKVFRFLGYLLVTAAIVSGCALISATPQTAPAPNLPASNLPALSSTTAQVDALPEQDLITLPQPGPWQDITQLIEYGGKLWFTNSVTGINHNSADIYSYHPATGETRYERHLFSQDAGQPVVANGLLYWPFEDPRFSASLGEYMVTNGEQWQWRVLPEGKAFHNHAMAATPDALFSGTGAWAGQLQRSQDNGETWQVVYTHPTPSGAVSRLTTLTTLNDRLYVGVTALRSRAAKLLQWKNNAIAAVPDWPEGTRVRDLTSFNNWLYAINDNFDGSVTLFRTNGQTSEPVLGLAGHRVRALSAAENELWAVSTSDAGNFLWRSNNGLDWAVMYTFESMLPLDVATVNGQVYVGGRKENGGENGRGILMGPSTAKPLAKAEKSAIAPMPSVAASPTAATATEKMSKHQRDVEAILSPVAKNVDREMQQPLVDALLPLALSRSAASAQVLSEQLQSSFSNRTPAGNGLLFGGAVEAPATTVAQWYFLWAMGLNGAGTVPVAMLNEPWTTPQNDREKYWQTVPAATWTVGQIGQKDQPTLAALIGRLSKESDPLWLKGDVIGALSALTNERFGYDTAAWQNWWQKTAPTFEAG